MKNKGNRMDSEKLSKNQRRKINRKIKMKIRHNTKHTFSEE